MTDADQFPRYRAPQENRQILCAPPWKEVVAQLKRPNATKAAHSVEILGVPLPTLAAEAKKDLVAEAHRYTNSYLDAGKPVDVKKPLILTGHQPEFVHPGVWLKNFAAAKLAREVGGTAISLVIDSDLCRVPAIRVPAGTVEQPRIEQIPFDQTQPEMPYEDRLITDRSLWNSFGDRVSQAIAPLIPNPLIAEWWPEVIGQTARATQLGLAIAQVRHKLEYRWGLGSLEVPQSRVCETPSFLRFALHILSKAESLRHDYNEALAEYRKVHRLRNAAQPLPNLSEVEGWIETPFWIWTDSTPARRALYVRPNGKELELSDRHAWQATLPLGEGGELGLERLASWSQQGIRLRSRALITTWYARLILADVFIHGIGGAKYDQVTDLLSERFFGLRPPRLTALSGTLRLPIEHPPVTPTRPIELQQALRELRYHPETQVGSLTLSLSERAEVDRLVNTKSKLINSPALPGRGAIRHAQIVSVNQDLQPWLKKRKHQLLHEYSVAITQLRVNQLLDSREYPSCLYPPQVLGSFLLDFQRQID